MRAILTYHSIDPSGSVISIDEATFERHVAFLASGRVDVLPLVELAKRSSGKPALALTFDDGFENFATHAWPRLRDAGLPVTLFVPSHRIGGDNAWGGRAEPGIPTLPLLDADALRELVGEGLALGSHSRTHAHLDQLTDAELVGEIEGSSSDLEQLCGVRPASFCYPFGDYDERSAMLVRAHYTAACTTELRLLSARDELHRLPRLDAYYYRSPERLECYGATRFQAHLKLRALARNLRRRLGSKKEVPTR